MEKELFDFANADERMLETVIDRYNYPLLRYCHNILCDYHEAQDALQITFIKAYQKRTAYICSQPLLPWLYRIAYTTCIDILRQRKRRQNIKMPEPVKADNHIPDNILQALLSLSPLDRALVYNRIMSEMPYDELAKIHSKSPSALRKRYQRARKKLADELKDDYPFYADTAKERMYE